MNYVMTKGDISLVILLRRNSVELNKKSVLFSMV